ncbi:iron-containing alcohol dehydrogenase [Alkalihalobacillus oceani]|uniref:Iron-containing alcohol dehydrogenase n=1 Tax=Halalkalibacter oceani TaxID=1653776 RepID=A0A9X2IMD0_9BACI|nr:iron-containing alcohol dehydrogenase [Halalkalibacter oceani]MCM3712611.1 iron-containing alcohol dehydrogenase [Halalkalibacter oceani]
MGKNYQFSIPTIIKCGRGISAQIGETLKSYRLKKLLIVTDKGVRQANLLEKIEASLRSSGIDYTIYNDVEPNPKAELVEEGVSFLNAEQCDSVLGIGGGSSLDTAKGIAAMVTNNGSILDYEGIGKLPNPTLPLFAIPTTAGTGSEATASTVFTDRETLFKAVIISPHLFPKVSFLDPDLILQLPQGITAATGMDALTHAIESYVSKDATPVSRALAIQAIKMIATDLEKTYFVGTDVESRENMLVASMLAGVAFSQSRLGNVHAISHTFGGVFNIPHGIANATLLPFVMEFNLPACAEKMKDIAVALGENVTGLNTLQAGEKAIEAVKRLNQSLNIPNNIKELGVSLDHLPQMVEDSMRSANVLSNPRLTRAEDIAAIIERAYATEEL